MILRPDLFNLIMVLAILFGFVQCFFGYRLFKTVLAITGFIVGAGLAAAISLSLYPHESTALVAGIVGGIIGAILSLTLYYVGVFFIGAFLGGIIGSTLISATGNDPNPIVLIIAVSISGIFALIIQKYMIMISTSFAGAWLIVTGVAYFATGAVGPTDIEFIFQSSGRLSYLVLLCWFILGVCGLMVQLKWLPTDQTREERDPVKQIDSGK